jgi:methyl-accepting chemotaxis protein
MEHRMSVPSPKRPSIAGGWLSLFSNQLLLSLLAVSLIPLALMGALTYWAASAALRAQAFRQLETVRTITARSVERYFGTLQEQLRVVSEDLMTVDALAQFTTGFESLLAEDSVDPAILAGARRDLSAFYTTEIHSAVQMRDASVGDMGALATALSDRAAILQDLYIRKNPNPVGSKELLDAAADDSAYTRTHATFHPLFRNLRARYNLYDVFLIDATNGAIVYSVCKEIDYGVSLRNGFLAATNFGKAVQEVLGSGRRDIVAFAQYEHYLPSAMAPACFIVAPVHKDRQLIGAVAFQMSVERLNEIVGERTGMGVTGETYAIGPDRLFQTNSRFAGQLGVATTIINPKFRIDTEPVRSALDQNSSGTAITVDYRDQSVLSSWTPITVHRDPASARGAVRWALVSEMQESEVLQPIASLKNYALTIFGLSTLGVLLVSAGIARRLTAETRRQASLIDGIVQNTHTLASSSEELTSVSQQMSAAAEETTAQANLVSAAAEQVSANARTVSGSIENLVTSIHDIARNAQDAATTARQAVTLAGSTSDTMGSLGRSSQEIGKVVNVITTIAEQTNLLALNATIEAARAGEAGRGFTVVANEVKELARETAKATDDIRARIEAMQTDTKRAVGAIDEIGHVIERIDSLQAKIAVAVEEQSVTTSEINRNIVEATTGSSEIAENILQVAQAAQSTAEGAANTQISSRELARMAQDLQRLVDDYRQ